MNSETEELICDLLAVKIKTDIDNDVLANTIGQTGGKIIFTSNYARCGNNPMAMSVSASTPPHFRGKHLPHLAPTWSMIDAYKNGAMSESEYSEQYIDLLENQRKLHPKEVLDSIPNGTILLCYESPKDFCHRIVLARWLEQASDMLISEWASEEELKKEQVVDDLLCF